MIIVKIGIQDGEREYDEWDYWNTFTEDDYLKGKITDREILSEFYGIEFGDNDYFDKDREKYWNDTSAVWVNSVMNISEEELNTLKKFLR
ncbi:hypothetical protein N9P69_00815 [Gammaproteobacteria bacterium]|jgi:hypothetical protein|nr:hypothetical protein [Gammaproteobacteria bacterium]|tara:strand:- start:313 stop:582 length:270 start_codon:yes stop_codon:yes gene_type:complete